MYKRSEKSHAEAEAVSRDWLIIPYQASVPLQKLVYAAYQQGKDRTGHAGIIYSLSPLQPSPLPVKCHQWPERHWQGQRRSTGPDRQTYSRLRRGVLHD